MANGITANGTMKTLSIGNNTYEVVDEQARTDIAALQGNVTTIQEDITTIQEDITALQEGGTGSGSGSGSGGSTEGSDITGTVAIANGGTGATTAADALTNLGAVAKAGDTMGGALIANATSVATLETAQVRNIFAGTADISEVEDLLSIGDIYLQYEVEEEEEE